mmetsp:Transcript_49932/g.95399  ORF Transcript_49932/g.95399 Transcript_49932/m.95399 type:complete len:102 (+) Transcript_49932:389-694(+)
MRVTCSWLWLIHTMALPARSRDLKTPSTFSTASGSRALVGSSNRKTSGSRATAMASCARCLCPPDSSIHGLASNSGSRPSSVAVASRLRCGRPRCASKPVA